MKRTRTEPRAGSYAATIVARIRAIPKGSVCTYGDIDPHAPRAVGRVLASTYADLPWHRVVRADGSAAMGARQLRLLRREGVPLRGDRIDFSLVRVATASEAASARRRLRGGPIAPARASR